MRLTNIPEDLNQKDLLKSLIAVNSSMSDMMINIYQLLAMVEKDHVPYDLTAIIAFYKKLAMTIESNLNDLNKILRKGKDNE